MLYLSQSNLDMVLAILDKYVPDKDVWAYGSRVTGKHHEGSDLDLVVIDPKDPQKRLTNLFALREAFSESNVSILVDVMDWAIIPESFQNEIKRQYVSIQSASNKPS